MLLNYCFPLSNDPNYFLSDEIRYHHRFLPFANLYAPPFMPHSDFVQMQNLRNGKLSVTELYQEAIVHFGQARTSFETYLTRLTSFKNWNPQHRTFTTGLTSVADIESYIKIAKTNTIVVQLLQKEHKPDTKIDFDFSVHAHYPILKL